MRDEKEMIDLIVGVAEKDQRIRGVYMNGSRTNPNAPKDIFQDYDFVYVVEETESFIEDEGWIDIFGERLYMQCPEKMDKMLGEAGDFENCYGYLIQLADGNRIDFHLQTLKYSLPDIKKDRLCEILLDKDMAFPGIPQATDKDHWVKKPTEAEFLCCCNEFWWILNNVGKGLWRGEIPYVMDMINIYMRSQFIKMLGWQVGINTDFSCSIGKAGKYIAKYLTAEETERFLSTYSNGNAEAVWQSVFRMCDMFDEAARKVAGGIGFSYNEKEAGNSRLFFDCTYELPSEAKEITLVRRMKEKDIDRIGEIWLESNISTHFFIPESYWMDNYESVKKMIAETEVYVYEDGDGIHGFAGIDKGSLEGIFVRKGMRLKGVGRALMNICKAKYFRIYLKVYCKNANAVNFYLHEGFTINRKSTNTETNHTEYEMTWRKCNE